MRRLVPVLVVLSLALLAAAGAGAASGRPLPTIDEGAAHESGGVKVEGWVFVKNTAARLTRAARVYTGVSNPKGTDWLGYRTAPALRPGKRHRMRFSYPLPKGLEAGAWRIDVCVGGTCIHAGRFMAPSPKTPAPTPQRPQTPQSAAPPREEHGTGALPPPAPLSTVPTDPIAHPTDEPFLVEGEGARYYGFVPSSYDASNQTPTTLFVWLHGCFGEAEGDAWVVDPDEGGTQDWLTLSLAGRETPGDECWIPRIDEAKVLAAIADFETHFNVDRRRVILGGYSSGGDLAYRTGFFHSATFAGLLIENSAPFRDTEASEEELLGAATTKFHIVHLAHAEDGTYRLGEVTPEIEAVERAGFPVEFIVRPGGHSDATTDPDRLTYLLPHIDDGWSSPAPTS